MPCDTIQRSQVEFLANVTDLDLLKKALEGMGFTVQIVAGLLRFSKYGIDGTFDKATGKLTSRGTYDVNVTEVKKAYGEQVVVQTAQRHGWKIEWSTNKAGNKEATVRKRS